MLYSPDDEKDFEEEFDEEFGDEFGDEFDEDFDEDLDEEFDEDFDDKDLSEHEDESEIEIEEEHEVQDKKDAPEEHEALNAEESKKTKQKEETQKEKIVESVQPVTDKEELKIAKPEEIPLTVVVEVGRLKMNVKKLLEIQPGNLLELDLAPEKAVDLVVAGKRVAKGELMRVGDALGIRVLELG